MKLTGTTSRNSFANSVTDKNEYVESPDGRLLLRAGFLQHHRQTNFVRALPSPLLIY